MTSKMRNRERTIETWEELKTLIQKRFIPSHYYHDFYQKLQNFTQGTKSMEDYYKKMEVVMIMVNVEKDREVTMSRFSSDLDTQIGNVIKLQYYVELENMMHIAIKVEKQLKKKSHSITS